MREMRGVEIDVENRRARVEAGAVWEDVVVPATEHGLTALHGSSPNVGVVGYTLGGGIGWYGPQARPRSRERAGRRASSPQTVRSFAPTGRRTPTCSGRCAAGAEGSA